MGWGERGPVFRWVRNSGRGLWSTGLSGSKATGPDPYAQDAEGRGGGGQAAQGHSVLAGLRAGHSEGTVPEMQSRGSPRVGDQAFGECPCGESQPSLAHRLERGPGAGMRGWVVQGAMCLRIRPGNFL